MNLKQYALLLMVSVVTAILTSGIFVWGYFAHGKIRTSQLELVDERGQIRALIDATGTLRLMDDHGQDRMVLSVFGSPRWRCLNSSGGSMSEFEAIEGGKCSLEFRDASGKLAVRMGVNEGLPDRPRLEVFRAGQPVWAAP